MLISWPVSSKDFTSNGHSDRAASGMIAAGKQKMLCVNHFKANVQVPWGCLETALDVQCLFLTF